MASLEKVCKIILRDCMAVKPSETALIVTDKGLVDIAMVLLTEANKFTKAKLIEIPVGKVHGDEPPEYAAKDMLKYDVEILLTTKSLSHTTARKNASEHGARIASMPNVTRSILERAIDVDYAKINGITKRVNTSLQNAKLISITTKIGTDITLKPMEMSKKEDQGLYHQKGEWGNLPAGEVCFSPVEGSANGIFVVDASMSGIGLVKHPIRITVEDGCAVKIEGKKEAKQLNQLLASLKDKRAYNIAELGIGTNYKAKITGHVIEDEKVMGTAHIALGNNISFGGSVDAPCHLDGVFRKPTITADGKYIMRNGKFVI